MRIIGIGNPEQDDALDTGRSGVEHPRLIHRDRGPSTTQLSARAFASPDDE
jgi:hypothetical protein